WEGGSAAFGVVDAYSDLDLTFLVDDTADFGMLYLSVEKALRTVSEIAMAYSPPIGRYYKLTICNTKPSPVRPKRHPRSMPLVTPTAVFKPITEQIATATVRTCSAIVKVPSKNVAIPSR